MPALKWSLEQLQKYSHRVLGSAEKTYFPDEYFMNNKALSF